ncbi:Glycoprotein-N-acetylgalactosamine 3-beta-galactosyltransferase [Fasciolopsis buskii]|uniref:Glycoprotein-N-acetylgalactosamine 3-beta-galactosyltransferase n=1 Tax=Fasciolopsis buskii TaxID=27845 RepID=A0A8E0RRQ2_9TREM|nr:Glycoprotein-N-acetylgalactosamine 3-beta-galactosyltransferase [Fasciolopsis buski]
MIIFGMITMKSMLIILKGFDSAYVKQLLVHSGNIPYGKDKELQEYNKPRILCILLTHPGNYDKKAIHTQNTWARRCTNWSFISTTKHSKLRLLEYNQTKPDAYRYLWAKMKDAYKAVYRQVDQYDYVFKGDDDTYLLYENLEALVSQFSSDQLIHTGLLLRDGKSPQFFSGGSGYILSREALKATVDRGINSNDRTEKCNLADGPEDTRLADCARAVGVAQYRCLESNQTELFFNQDLDYMISRRHLRFTSGRKPNWRQKSYSQHLVSMHYMNGPMEYVVEFLIYYVGTYLRQELLDDPKVETEMPKFICTRKYPQDGAN